jgi:fido (protein-threonine AMPylation protein)
MKPEDLLSEKFIKDLHRRMYGEACKWAGTFRNSEKNLIIKCFFNTSSTQTTDG